MSYQDKIKSTLNKLPHKLQVQYALMCANTVKHLMDDERSINALDATAKWLNGEATDEELENTASAAYASAVSAYASAASAAYAAANTAYAASAAYAAANTAYNATKTSSQDIKVYYDLLLKFLSNLTELEKVMYNINKGDNI